MSGSFGIWIANYALDLVAGGQPFTPASTLYLGLYSKLPDPSGQNGVEFSGGGYARVAIPNTPSTWNAASNGQKTNAIPIIFPVATQNLGVAVGAALWDAPTGGNLYFFGNLTEAKSVFTGAIPQIPPGSLVLKGTT